MDIIQKQKIENYVSYFLKNPTKRLRKGRRSCAELAIACQTSELIMNDIPILTQMIQKSGHFGITFNISRESCGDYHRYKLVNILYIESPFTVFDKWICPGRGRKLTFMDIGKYVKRVNSFYYIGGRKCYDLIHPTEYAKVISVDNDYCVLRFTSNRKEMMTIINDSAYLLLN